MSPRSLTSLNPTDQSHPVSRKGRSASAAPQDDDDDDLFADTGSSPTSADTSDHSARRQEVLQKISTISSLPNREKKREASSFRVGSLRKMVQLCDKPEELDELRRALRGWRVMGMRVTPKTAEEIAGEAPRFKLPDFD